jgi:hypothetical protein
MPNLVPVRTPKPRRPRANRVVTPDAVRRALFNLGRFATVRAVRKALGDQGSLRDIARVMREVRAASPELEEGLWSTAPHDAPDLAAAVASLRAMIHDATTRQSAQLQAAMDRLHADRRSAPAGELPAEALARMGQRIGQSVELLDRELTRRIAQRLDQLDERQSALDAAVSRFLGLGKTVQGLVDGLPTELQRLRQHVAKLETQLKAETKRPPSSPSTTDAEDRVSAQLVDQVRGMTVSIDAHHRQVAAVLDDVRSIAAAVATAERVTSVPAPSADPTPAIAGLLDQLETRLLAAWSRQAQALQDASAPASTGEAAATPTWVAPLQQALADGQQQLDARVSALHRDLVERHAHHARRLSDSDAAHQRELAHVHQHLAAVTGVINRATEGLVRSQRNQHATLRQTLRSLALAHLQATATAGAAISRVLSSQRRRAAAVAKPRKPVAPATRSRKTTPAPPRRPAPRRTPPRSKPTQTKRAAPRRSPAKTQRARPKPAPRASKRTNSAARKGRR